MNEWIYYKAHTDMSANNEGSGSRAWAFDVPICDKYPYHMDWLKLSDTTTVFKISSICAIMR